MSLLHTTSSPFTPRFTQHRFPRQSRQSCSERRVCQRCPPDARSFLDAVRQQRKDCQEDEEDRATDDDHRYPETAEAAVVIGSQQGQEIQLDVSGAIRLAVGTHIVVRRPPIDVLRIL